MRPQGWRRFPALTLLALLWAVPAVSQDAAGCKDHPLLTRIPDFVIDGCESSEFDSHRFYDRHENEVVFEGRKTTLGYCLRDGGRERSFLEIWKNYANAVTTAGGTVEYRTAHSGNLHLGRDGREFWVWLNDAGGNCFTLVIVEQQAMIQEITASEMLDTLHRQGVVALSITFETNQAVIRPESQGLIDQVAAMLTTEPSLVVSIEGHTDDTGTPAHNRSLSQRRAEAVVASLVGRGIAARRLSAIGWGQDKPVADNRTDEGRARNRRVEIVRK
jgi:OmpA-OmpF porin, OOP family